MSVFNKKDKKVFAFDESAKVSKISSVEEFIKSGTGDKQSLPKKSNAGRPKRKGAKPMGITVYLTPKEKEQLEIEAKNMYMSLAGYLKRKVLS